MNSKIKLAFVASFTLLIFGLPLWDALQSDEWSHGRIFRDTFITPMERQESLQLLVDSIQGEIQRFEKNPEKAEDTYYLMEDLKAKVSTVNPYVELDSSDAILITLEQLLKDWRQNLDQDEQPKWNQELQKSWETVQADLPIGKNSIQLWTEAFLTGTFFKHSYLRQFEKAMEDESWVASQSRENMQEVQARVFNNYGSKAIVGDDDWLFYRPGVNYLTRASVLSSRSKSVDANDKPIHESPIDAIVDFRDQLARKNIELLVVVVPSKANIYPEKLEPSISLDPSEDLGYSSLYQKMLRDQGVHTTQLFELFHQEKHSQELYLKHDTHWTPIGAEIAAREIAHQVRSILSHQFEDLKAKAHSKSKIEYQVKSKEVKRIGDLAEMSELESHFQPRIVKANQVYQVWRDSVGEVLKEKLYKDKHRQSPILYLGDSFSRIYQTDAPRSAGVIAHLAKELEMPLSSLVSEGGASTLVRQKLARQKGRLKGKAIVIWEFVERDFRYGAEGWKIIKY